MTRYLILAASICVCLPTASVAAHLTVAAYGGAAVPLGGLAAEDPGYFNWFWTPPNPQGHGLVDIRGFTLTGSNMAAGPAAALALRAGLTPWLELEWGGGRYFLAPRATWVRDAIHNPKTSVAAVTMGARGTRRWGPVAASAGAGAGYYLETLTLDAAGHIESGFVYDKVDTIDNTTDIGAPGAYAGAGASYALADRWSLELDLRYHIVFNRGDYDVLIHEEYGYEPYHHTDYVFEIPLHKEYADQFLDVRAGLAYAVF